MKIIREVNGQTMEFELTYMEMHDTFNEYQHMCDCEDISCFENEDEFDNTVEPFDKILELYPDFNDKCANRYRKYRNYDDSWASDARDAVEWTLEYYNLLKEE